MVLHQTLESVSFWHSCGDLLFPDDHHLSGILVKKQSLSCESPIEKGFYNCKDRGLKLKDICYHCGAGGSNKFIMGMEQLKERCMTGEFYCFPVCTACLDKGKKVITKGRMIC